MHTCCSGALAAALQNTASHRHPRCRPRPIAPSVRPLSIHTAADIKPTSRRSSRPWRCNCCPVQATHGRLLAPAAARPTTLIAPPLGTPHGPHGLQGTTCPSSPPLAYAMLSTPGHPAASMRAPAPPRLNAHHSRAAPRNPWCCPHRGVDHLPHCNDARYCCPHTTPRARQPSR
jgi:hypothetical protein